MAKTSTRAQQAASPPPTNHGQVAVIQPPRLPFHPAIEERFGVDRAGWKVLCESIFPSARTPDAIVLALSYCKARRLDPFKRNIHIVPIYDAKKGVEVETVWPGIAELRTTAMRTKGYAGMDPPEFGPMKTQKFYGTDKSGNQTSTEVTFPEWCRITVYRIVQGNRVAFPGPTVFWLEFYNKKSRFTEEPNEQWKRRPSQMAEKCSEAGALRRAFPEEFGEEYTVEELGAFGSLASARNVDAEVIKTTPPAEPRRADFTEAERRPVEAGEVTHDAETGEVQDNGQAVTSPPTAAGDDSQPEVAGQPEPDRPWKMQDNIMGQDARMKFIRAQFNDQAETPDEVDAIKAEHAAFIAKLGSKRAAFEKEMADRWAMLGGGQ